MPLSSNGIQNNAILRTGYAICMHRVCTKTWGQCLLTMHAQRILPTVVVTQCLQRRRSDSLQTRKVSSYVTFHSLACYKLNYRVTYNLCHIVADHVMPCAPSDYLLAVSTSCRVFRGTVLLTIFNVNSIIIGDTRILYYFALLS